MTDVPKPGEVWIVSDPIYGPESWHKIHYADRPFIVTYVSVARIGFVRAGEGPDGESLFFARGPWSWHKHCTRIWPPVPSWEELEDKSGLSADDLRARALAGEA